MPCRFSPCKILARYGAGTLVAAATASVVAGSAGWLAR